MLVLGMLGFLSAGMLLSGCKSAPELTKANALALIQAKYDQTPAAGVAIAVDVHGLKDGVQAKYWEKATVYANRIWGDFKLTPDGKKVLQRISRETGGTFFEVSKKQPIDKIYERVQEELRNQYSLGYTSDQPNSGTDYRRISLITNQKSLIVQTREGYYPISTGNER